MKRINNMVPIAPASHTPFSQQPEDIYRKKRTRAKRSCDKCRKRKTKCDADVRQPCTKCRLANATCEFLVEQKKRGPSSGGYIEVLENRLLRMEKLIKNIKKDKGVDSAEEGSDDDFMKDRNSSSSSLSSPARCEDDDANPRLTCSDLLVGVVDKDYDNMEQQMNNLTISDYQRTRYIGASSGVQFLDDDFLQTNIKHALPDEPSWFVQKLNDELDEHIIMKSKQIPPPPEINEEFQTNRIEIFEDTPHITQELADYLVHVYFTRVHTYCPVINKTQFLEQYYFHNPTPPDQYLLFAITSIGTSLFIPEILSIKTFDFTPEQLAETSNDLRAKAHTILNVVYKRSMISTVQTLMLLSMFVSHDNDEEDTAHWFITGMAIRMAQDLGLHRDCSKWKIPDYEIELRKRLWYAAYLMDRWVAAELGRPVSILDHEFDVELPTPYELNSPPKHRDTTPILILEAEAALKLKTPVYAGFVYLITLSQIAGQVLVGFHSTRAKQNRENNLDLLKILESNLTAWKLSLPKELVLDLNNPRDDIFYAPACVVNMACDCVWILLYRSFIKHNKDRPENTGLAFKALSICTACAVNLISVVEAVEYHAFVSLPWNMAVYAVFQAAIIFLHNAKGENPFLKKQGRLNLIRCARVYNDDPYLRKTRVVHVLQHVASNFEVYIGSPVATSIGNRRKRDEESNNLLDRNTSPLVSNYSCIPTSTTSKYNPNEEPASKQLRNNPAYMTDPFFASFKTPSERSADMFHSSLSFGLGKGITDAFLKINEPNENKPQEITQQPSYQDQQQTQQRQQHHQLIQQRHLHEQQQFLQQQQMQQQQQLHHHLQEQTQKADQLYRIQQQEASRIGPGTNNGGYTESVNEPFYNLPPQATQFDLASLSSEIPLWEVPSGATWNEWESFLKSNTDNQNHGVIPM